MSIQDKINLLSKEDLHDLLMFVFGMLSTTTGFNHKHPYETMEHVVMLWENGKKAEEKLPFGCNWIEFHPLEVGTYFIYFDNATQEITIKKKNDK